jgi:hypothetical protein
LALGAANAQTIAQTAVEAIATALDLLKTCAIHCHGEAAPEVIIESCLGLTRLAD